MNPRSHQATFRWNSGSFWANLVQHSADAMRGKLARCEVLRNGEGSPRRARSQDGRGTAIRCEPSALSFGVRRRRWRPRDWNPVPSPHVADLHRRLRWVEEFFFGCWAYRFRSSFSLCCFGINGAADRSVFTTVPPVPGRERDSACSSRMAALRPHLYRRNRLHRLSSNRTQTV